MNRTSIIIYSCVLLLLMAGCSKKPPPFRENPFDPSVDGTGLITLIDSSHEAIPTNSVWRYYFTFQVDNDRLTNAEYLKSFVLWIAVHNYPTVLPFDSTGRYSVYQSLYKGRDICINAAFINDAGDTSRRFEVSCFHVPE